MLIVPAIDIFEGKCVRLCQGDYKQRTTYEVAPSVIGEQFANAGFKLLHVVDLEGAKEKRIVNWKSIESISKINGIEVEVGGGIRTSEDIQRLIDIGVKRVIIGSVSAKSPELVEYWIKQFGVERIVVGMDVKNETVAVSGWLEVTHIKPVEFMLDLIKRGARNFICTDISRDGTLEGVNIEFFRNMRLAFPQISLFASGGISSIEDIKALGEIGMNGVIIGKAIYEGKISLEDLVKVSNLFSN